LPIASQYLVSSPHSRIDVGKIPPLRPKKCRAHDIRRFHSIPSEDTIGRQRTNLCRQLFKKLINDGLPAETNGAQPGRFAAFDWWGTGMTGINVHRRSTPEELVAKMCEVDMLVVQGLTIMEALRTLGLRLATYRHWREELDGLRHDEAERLKVLQAENAELRRVADELTVRTAALRNAVRRGERVTEPRSYWRPGAPSIVPAPPGHIAGITFE
jgi:putative transposase